MKTMSADRNLLICDIWQEFLGWAFSSISKAVRIETAKDWIPYGLDLLIPNPQELAQAGQRKCCSWVCVSEPHLVSLTALPSCSSVCKSCSALCDPTDFSTPRSPVLPGLCSDSCPWSQWCHPTISSSGALFSSLPDLLQMVIRPSSQDTEQGERKNLIWFFTWGTHSEVGLNRCLSSENH